MSHETIGNSSTSVLTAHLLITATIISLLVIILGEDYKDYIVNVCLVTAALSALNGALLDPEYVDGVPIVDHFSTASRYDTLNTVGAVLYSECDLFDNAILYAILSEALNIILYTFGHFQILSYLAIFMLIVGIFFIAYVLFVGIVMGGCLSFGVQTKQPNTISDLDSEWVYIKKQE